jgi:hypothetical protein
MTSRRLGRSGSASVEFALVGAVYCLCAILVLCLSVTLCAKAVAEMTAWDTARCSAIGSADCPRPDDFARGLVRKWGGGALARSVQVSTMPATMCGDTSGVAVNLTFGTTILAERLVGGQLGAKACFPLVRDER